MIVGATFVDLSCPLNENTRNYSTDPQFKMTWHLEFKAAGACISRLDMGPHSGSHVDAPLHFIEDGLDVASMPLDTFIGDAIAVDAPKKTGENIVPDDFISADIRPGDIVLVRTGWEEYANTERYFGDTWPGFTNEAVDYLIEKRVKGFGGDIASIEIPEMIPKGCPAHRRALGAGLPLFESLVNLRQVAGKRFLFIGLPIRIEGCEASPIRALAVLN